MLVLRTRAGLVALFSFALCIALGACAPISHPQSSPAVFISARRSNDHLLTTTSAFGTRLKTAQITGTEAPHVVLGHTINTKESGQIGMERSEGLEVVRLVRRKSLGQKIKDAFHKVKNAFKKVGHAIVHAAKKVGHFFKETGKKIAKVALKVAAVATKAVSKVVGFIPGVGKIAGKALEGGSKGLNAASDAIHCKMGGKLGTAMHRMDKGLKVMSYIP